ncbi:MAG: hypothetical protein AAGA35_03355 [Patescibacteria group bacterium]
MQKAIYIIGGIGIAAGILTTVLMQQAEPSEPELIACTADARICPDGSGVGREGPQCQFAACPPIGVALNETVAFGLTVVTPLRVTEDNRCPADAQCAWEGTIMVEVMTEEDGRSKTSVMSIGDTLRTSFGVIVLSSVEPTPVSNGSISNSQYRFVFSERR